MSDIPQCGNGGHVPDEVAEEAAIEGILTRTQENSTVPPPASSPLLTPPSPSNLSPSPPDGADSGVSVTMNGGKLLMRLLILYCYDGYCLSLMGGYY